MGSQRGWEEKVVMCVCVYETKTVFVRTSHVPAAYKESPEAHVLQPGSPAVDAILGGGRNTRSGD